MKKTLRYMLSLVLMLALMLSMGTAALADKTDGGLPVEYVSYGIGLSDAPGVDKHGLGDKDLTIDGVSWKPDTSEDKLYVHILDLAAAKLLRGCADEAKELGLDYSKLYIENGLIQVKEDVPSAEAAELKGKLDKLTYAAVIGVVGGDVFEVGSGGEAKLQIMVAGFATVAGDEPATAQETAKRVLDVKGIGLPLKEIGPGDKGGVKTEFDPSAISGTNFAGVTNTTIYIIYGGATWYGFDGSSDDDKKPSCYANDGESQEESSGDEKQPPKENIPGGRSRTGGIGIAKAAGDENNYYIRIVGVGGEPKYVPVGDLASKESSPDIAQIVNIINENSGDIAGTIYIATDPDGNNIVMTIKLKDGTATPEQIYGSDEEESPGETDKGETEPPKEEVPGDDKTEKPKEEIPSGDDKVTPLNETGENGDPASEENTGEDESDKIPGYEKWEPRNDGLWQYDPEDIVDVDHTTGEETADVTVRDTVLVPPLMS